MDENNTIKTPFLIDMETVRHNDQLIEWAGQFNQQRSKILFAVGIYPDGNANVLHVTGISKDKIVFLLRELANNIDLNGQKHGLVI